MGKILDEMLAIVESRCSVDPEAEAAFAFLTEWITVSQEAGLDPEYVRAHQLKLQEQEQARLF